MTRLFDADHKEVMIGILQKITHGQIPLDTDNVSEQANLLLDSLYSQYHANPSGVSVSFRDLCSGWTWAKRSDVYTHLIHSYPAKMLAYIPILFLSTEKYASRLDSILDVFTGSATVLLESIINPVFPRDAYGIEINPLARLIAKVKTTPIDPENAKRLAKQVAQSARSTSEETLPVYSNLDYWYSEKIKQKLGNLAWAIDNVETDVDTRDFLLVCFSVTTKKLSYADPDIPVPVRLKYKTPRKGRPPVEQRNAQVKQLLAKIDSSDPISVFLDVANANVRRLRMLCSALEGKTTKAEIIGADARSLFDSPMGSKGHLDQTQAKLIQDKRFSLIITSPPYGTAQKYIRSTRLEMLWLGLATDKQVTALEKQSVGTEAVAASSLKTLVATGFQPIDEMLEQISKKDLSRACLESIYFRDMTMAIKEIYRVLRPNGTLVMVIGDNTTCDLSVPNHYYIKLIAESVGFREELLIKDPVRSRGMMTKRHETAGMVEDDWVTVLRKGN